MGKKFIFFEALSAVKANMQPNGSAFMPEVFNTLLDWECGLRECECSKFLDLLKQYPHSFILESNIPNCPDFVSHIRLTEEELNTSYSLSDLVSFDHWNSAMQDFLDTIRPEQVLPNFPTRYNKFDAAMHMLSCVFSCAMAQGRVAFLRDKVFIHTTRLNRAEQEILLVLQKNAEDGNWPFKFVKTNTKFYDYESHELWENGLLPKPLDLSLTETEQCSPKSKIDFITEHICKDNAVRFPRHILQSITGNQFEVKDTITLSPEEFDEYKSGLCKFMEEHPDAVTDLEKKVKEAIARSIDRMKNYSNIPRAFYYPEKNRIMQLIPLAFSDDSMVDLAMVVGPNGKNKYLGITILTREMAFFDTSLMEYRPLDWLMAA